MQKVYIPYLFYINPNGTFLSHSERVKVPLQYTTISHQTTRGRYHKRACWNQCSAWKCALKSLKCVCNVPLQRSYSLSLKLSPVLSMHAVSFISVNFYKEQLRNRCDLSFHSETILIFMSILNVFRDAEIICRYRY